MKKNQNYTQDQIFNDIWKGTPKRLVETEQNPMFHATIIGDGLAIAVTIFILSSLIVTIIITTIITSCGAEPALSTTLPRHTCGESV